MHAALDRKFNLVSGDFFLINIEASLAAICPKTFADILLSYIAHGQFDLIKVSSKRLLELLRKIHKTSFVTL